MQNHHRQNKRLVTYGKSPRTKSHTDLGLNTTYSEQVTSTNVSSTQGLYRRLGNPPQDSYRNSSKRPTSNTKYNLLSEGNSTKVEVSGGSFPSSRGEKMGHYLDQRKRKKLDFVEPPTILSDSQTPRSPSSNDDFPNRTNDNALGKQSLASETATENAALTRKRVVDSLGIMEQRTEEPTPLSASNDITLDHSNTVQEKDLDTNSYESDTYDSSQQSAITSSTQSRNSRVTYARERSFLNDHSSVGSSKNEALLDGLKQNYRPEQPRPGSRSHLYTHNDEDKDSGSVRGLHELRKAGENARFRSLVDLIFDDIEEALKSNSDPSNGFVQLCTKLLDPDSVRCFLDCGLGKRFLQCIISDLETVPASFALCAYELIRSSGLSSTLLAPFLPALLGLSSRLIDLDDDILSLATKYQGFVASKSVERVVWRLSSGIYGEQSDLKISPRIVGLRCIQSVLSNCPETGRVISAVPGALLEQLVSLLTLEIPLGPENFPMHPESFQASVLALSILEVFTTLLGSLADDSRDSYQPLSQICRIFDMCEHCYGNDQYQHILILYIRVVLNITNNNPLLCEVFSTPRLVSGLVSIIRKEFGEVPSEMFSEATSMGAADAVILALGTLINLAEKCKKSRVIFLQTASNSSRLLDQLLTLFSVSIDSILEVSYS